MNTIQKQKSRLDKKLIIFYVLCITFCVFAIFVAVYIEFFSDANMGLAMGIKNNMSDDEYNKLKSNFDELFDNKLNSKEDVSTNVKKIDNNSEIVYTSLAKNEITEKYDINISIPKINISNEVAYKFNDDIKSTFEDKLNSIIEKNKGSVIYTVEYTAYINKDVLSVMIKSTLKEGNNAQRVIVQTYNYDLNNNTEFTINNALSMKNISEKDANNKIQNEIELIEEQVKSLSDLGYSIFKRNPTDDLYKINNVKDFYIGKDNNLYVIYAYGNYNNTSEIDLVIF